MGKNYLPIPMKHSWERITSFAPWVTHGVELLAVNSQKYLHMLPYIGKELSFVPQKGHSC